MTLQQVKEEPWYRDGLHFKCTECGQCCTGAPGYVWISDQEALDIATNLGITVEVFYQKYTVQINGRRSLRDKPYANYDCVFLKGNKCQIYSVRPTQCRTFPWWPQHLKSEKAWREAAKECEGINSSMPLVPREVIDERLEFQKQHQS